MHIELAYPRTSPPSLMASLAGELDDGGVDELWVIEDRPRGGRAHQFDLRRAVSRRGGRGNRGIEAALTRLSEA